VRFDTALGPIKLMGFAMLGPVIMRTELKLEKRDECAKSPVEILFFRKEAQGRGPRLFLISGGTLCLGYQPVFGNLTVEGSLTDAEDLGGDSAVIAALFQCV